MSAVAKISHPIGTEEVGSGGKIVADGCLGVRDSLKTDGMGCALLSPADRLGCDGCHRDVIENSVVVFYVGSAFP